MKKKVRLLAGPIIILLTILAFTYYLAHHSYLLKQLGQTSISTIILLLVLYGFWFVALAMILQACLRICKKAVPAKENLLLNAYSTLVNFFVPGQSGPVVRGAYLKKRHKLRVRDYVLAFLLYYASYAVVSTFLLLSGSRLWWQTLIAMLAAVVISILAIGLYGRRNKTTVKMFDLSLSNIAYLLLATIFQAIVQVAIYAVELHSVNPSISLWQIMAYTGAANFALFVALTPGAIGIRESFLLLSRRLHHISSANIVAASVIDRSVFFVFLAILFIVTLSFHAKDKLKIEETVASAGLNNKIRP